MPSAGAPRPPPAFRSGQRSQALQVRLRRRQRPRGFSTQSLGPDPERACPAWGFPRAVSGARPPSPHFPWGIPTEPFLREDAFFSFLLFGELSRSSPAPRSGGAPPGPGPGKARRVWRGSDAGKAERTSSGRAHWLSRRSGAGGGGGGVVRGVGLRTGLGTSSNARHRNPEDHGEAKCRGLCGEGPGWGPRRVRDLRGRWVLSPRATHLRCS